MLGRMTIAYIALGSNLGKRQIALRAALDRVSHIPQTTLKTVATFRQTLPVDCSPGTPDFINTVAAVETELFPKEFLSHLLNIERELGRDRSDERNAPRTIDLDILLFGEQIVASPALVIPHPRMHLRLFVLEPLAEIAAAAVHPTFRKTIAELLAELRSHAGPSHGGSPL
jgi:2-amino-4-hydroxy-6-hydroxymethyldihydropteridine diphosphokinase